MDVGHQVSATKVPSKFCILLLDENSERRASRTRIMALHGVEVIGAASLAEAASVWDRNRYDMVLIDIRRDYWGCLAWRDEIKREKPLQKVAFLVGRPRYVDLDPLENSYVAEQPGMEWGDSLRLAIRQSCVSLPQRNGFTEAMWRIAAARKINGTGAAAISTKSPRNISVDGTPVPAADSQTIQNIKPGFAPGAVDPDLPISPESNGD